MFNKNKLIKRFLSSYPKTSFTIPNYVVKIIFLLLLNIISQKLFIDVKGLNPQKWYEGAIDISLNELL